MPFRNKAHHTMTIRPKKEGITKNAESNAQYLKERFDQSFHAHSLFSGHNLWKMIDRNMTMLEIQFVTFWK